MDSFGNYWAAFLLWVDLITPLILATVLIIGMVHLVLFIKTKTHS